MKKKMTKIVLIAILLLTAYLYYENHYMLVADTYTISSKKIDSAFDDFTILQLSDLHSTEFGEDNKKLIKKINDINPNIIVATGDMMNSEKDDGKVFINLVKNLDYPIYFINGNHEQICEYNTKEVYNAYKNELIKNNVHIIKNDKVKIKKDGKTINLLGLDIPLLYYSTKEDLKDSGNVYDINVFKKSLPLKQFDKDQFNILLVHDPTNFSIYNKTEADLVLTGHIHGGIVRLPIIGGIVSPYGDFFPKYSKGEYEENDTKLIVNAGLGNYTVNFRGFNPPELTIIKLKSK